MVAKLTDATVKSLPAPDRGSKITYFGGAMLGGVQAPPGFGVRVTAGGAKAFVLNYVAGGRERRLTIGQYGTWTPAEAVKRARELRQQIDDGVDPLADKRPVAEPEPVVTVEKVLQDYIARKVRGKMRPGSIKETERALLRQLAPRVGTVPVHELKRSRLMTALDEIEDASGPTQADKVLRHASIAFTWYAARDDDFRSPIIRGMARTKPAERARVRVLTDDELRAIWPSCNGVFGAIVKLLLLTGQRRNEVSEMTWREVDGDVWVIPAERYKTGRLHAVPLSPAALAVVEARPKQADFVFTAGRRPFTSMSHAKHELDTAAGVTGWRLHDLRRTAKVLMVRAGVRPDISERVLGHVIAGAEGVYDRHSYLVEKRDALERLAGMVDRIVNPVANVVLMRGAEFRD